MVTLRAAYEVNLIYCCQIFGSKITRRDSPSHFEMIKQKNNVFEGFIQLSYALGSAQFIFMRGPIFSLGVSDFY